ncbi:MAG: oligoendopeptidase F [Ponticaulis sp.]|nr:oligoendopeptidase F [Ponticaulis sp.]
MFSVSDFMKKITYGASALATFMALGTAAPVLAEPNTEAAEASSETYVWDLTDIYADTDEWAEAYAEVEARLEGLTQYKGTLGDSAEALETALRDMSDTAKEAVRVYVYTSLTRDQDQRVPESQEMFGKAMALFQTYNEAVSWVDPELLTVGEETIRGFMAENPDLEPFTFQLENTLRRAPYTLDADGEALMAQASLALSQANEIYSLYANASITWPTATLSDGSEVKLNQAGYSRYRAVSNRDDRKLVFDTFWGAWNEYESGMGATLNAQVLSAVFRAKARGYDSVLQRALFDDNLPPEIYTQLVDQVNAALPTFHRYLKMRGQMLDIDDLGYFDIYPPIIEADTGVFDLKRSEELTFQSLKPFGEEYLALLREGLDGKWMHSHPQEGKETGAYMNGSVYDVHPYVLLNHNDDYDSMSTFSHEWGHAVHTMLAKTEQPFETASYSTFIAEMASTINEILLQEYMIENAETKEEKLFYLGEALESLRGTFFRQTMFGEFELAIHEAAERGEPLTGAKMTQMYGELLKKYHGHDQGVMNIDDTYAIEWAFIPHFYYEFYVYQYATSISGAAWFAEQFLGGDEDVKENFLNVLRAGGSDYPHNILLNEAGLDMTKPDAYQAVVRRMNSIMDRMDALMAED